MTNSEFHGTAVIARALAKNLRVFDDRAVVPHLSYYNSSYSTYNIPLLTSKRNLYKTIIINKSKSINLNYALRASVLALKEIKHQIPVHCTVNFSQKFSKSLYSMKNPVSYCGQRYKQYFSQIGIDDFFLVIEKSRSGRLHAHIVTSVNQSDIPYIKQLLSNSNEIQLEPNGKLEAHSVFIDLGYEIKIYKQHIDKHKKELLEMEIADYPELTTWRKSNPRERHLGISFVRRVNSIDVGLPDYLCKQLNSIIFKNSISNFYISNTLRRKLNAIAEPIIEANKICKGFRH
ncbi:hypothetical protein [Thalassotalea sp. PP2-459]|uniref:hypothetical protein n=1 Tax=Thalassotalea sp. PP2-459 TaxID=1742724 RepID=UPI0009428157|nr:hypothetical protein [Thalassotalea sp. PP2-459]OKY25661.1 hypothetical protein BI291_15145 [Thalassotalea sp. PP2-459]